MTRKRNVGDMKKSEGELRRKRRREKRKSKTPKKEVWQDFTDDEKVSPNVHGSHIVHRGWICN